MNVTIFEAGGVNLDGEDRLDLIAFDQLVTACARAAADRLFPDEPIDDAVTAVKRLALYARDKATAMHLRAEGNIESALVIEEALDFAYARLPEFAQW